MEVTSPTWDGKQYTYTFRITIKPDDTTTQLQGQSVFVGPEMDLSGIELPVMDARVLDTIVHKFVDQTKQWFTTPLGTESLKQRLRHVVSATLKPEQEGWYEAVWRPSTLKIKRSQFQLYWTLTEWKASSPKISAEFCMGSATPRAQSPVQPPTQEELRTIHIQDTLVPVGDLPLSDLPPLSFYAEPDTDQKRQEIRQKIREARLRVALAKLKAERMEYKYYERYGEMPAESENSSDLSSDSESADEPLGRQTYS